MEKNKTDLIQKLKIIFIILLILLIGIMIASVIYYRSTLKNDGPTNIEDALNYYGCTLIKVEKSSEDGFSKDIYVKLKKPPVEENGYSNKVEYENIIKDVSNAVNNNYRIIDEEKQITIRVAYDNNTLTSTYTINGDHNYFSSQQALIQKAKLNVNSSNLIVNSRELQAIINAGWIRRDAQNIGTVDSSALNYDIYFDEGFKINTHGINVYNVVFTHQYKGNVINNISTNMTNDDVKKILGEPTFNLNKGLIIGYKSEDLYAFFVDGEISIYRVNKLDENKNNQFAELVGELNKSGDVTTFYNNLILLYPNPESTIEDEEELITSYPEYGFTVNFGKYKNTITIYRNYQGKVTPETSVEDLIDGNVPINISTQFNEDLIFETEKIRYGQDFGYRGAFTKELDDLNISILTEKYAVISEKNTNTINFFSIHKTSLDSSITYFSGTKVLKYTDTTFIYNIPNKGIYYYNAESGQTTTIIEGENEFSLESIDGNVLKYDNGKTLNL